MIRTNTPRVPRRDCRPRALQIVASRWATALLLCFVSNVPVAGQNASGREPARISGKALDVAGNPVAGVTVLVLDSTDDIATARTASDGTYQIDFYDLPPTQTPLFVQFAGSASTLNQFYSMKDRLSAADTLMLGPGMSKTGINAVLTVQGSASISGRVTDMDGEPVPAFQVSAGNWSGTAPNGTVWTADDGSYRIDYSNLTDTYHDIWVDAIDANNPVVYIADRVDSLTVGPGSHLAEINIRVKRAGSAYISGKVTDEAGWALIGVIVGVGDKGKSTVFNSTRTDTEGKYQLEVRSNWLPSSEIFVQFRPPVGFTEKYYDGKSGLDDANLMFVDPNAMLTGIDAVLERTDAADVTGTVTDIDGHPVAGTVVEVRYQSSPIANATTGTDGTFDVAVQPAPNDEVQVRFTGPDGYLPQYYRDSRFQAGARELLVEAGRRFAGVDARLLREAEARVSGTVTDQDGHPVGDVSVGVFTVPTGGGQSQSLGVSRTNSDGTYEITARDLPASLVEIVVRFGSDQYFDQFFRDKYEFEDADKLALEQGTFLDRVDVALVKIDQAVGDSTDTGVVDAPDLGGHGVITENRAPIVDSGGTILPNRVKPPDVSHEGAPSGNPDVADGPPVGNPDVADGPPVGNPDVADGPPAGDPDVARSISLNAPAEGVASFFFDVTINGLAEPNDQIVIALPGTKPTKSVYHKRLTVGNESVQIRLPNEPGDYELRVESASRPAVIKFSQPLHIRTPIAQLDAPETAKAGDRITVRCSGECSNNANVTVVPEGADAQELGPRGFLGGDQEVSIKLKKGKGAYEIRYVSKFNPRVVYLTKKLKIE